ncbi:hypothetical protein, partial [Nocardia cyriacigeorgica]|uniref:hypothetical protein n=1 Tax=Nocardia cyriacigeorgica TaxID=135487 RepID=UPI00189412BC
MSRSWHSTGVNAPEAAELAHRIEGTLRAAIKDGLARRTLLDDFDSAFDDVAPHDHTAAVEAATHPDQLAELGAA